jgi:hypothetical protein
VDTEAVSRAAEADAAAVEGGRLRTGEDAEHAAPPV